LANEFIGAIEKPDLLELGIDTMVMDNDEAEKREGVQPFQIIWKNKIVDAIFRGGKKHGNHGTTVARMVMELVRLIRSQAAPHPISQCSLSRNVPWQRMEGRL